MSVSGRTVLNDCHGSLAPRPGVESVGILRYLWGFGAIKRKCLDDRSLAFCRKVSFGSEFLVGVYATAEVSLETLYTLKLKALKASFCGGGL